MTALLPGPISRRVLGTDALLAGLLALVLLAASAVSASSVRESPSWLATATVAFVVLHLSVALHRTAPVVGYALACAAMLVIVLMPQIHLLGPVTGQPTAFPVLFLPSSLAFLPTLYALCVHAGRRVAVAGLVVAVGGVLLASFRAGPVVEVAYPPFSQYRLYLIFALLSSVSAAWGLGMTRAIQAEREAALRAEITRSAILADRSRIARDMHDVVSHSLAVIVRQAEGGALVAERSPDRAVLVLRTIADVGRDALTDMRGMLDVLRGPETAAPTETGNPKGAPSSLADLPALVARVEATGVRVAVTERGRPHEIGPAAQLAAYYVLQEGLTNVVKHAGPTGRARITVDWQPDTLLIELRDDGADDRGRPVSGPQTPVPGGGLGLRGLRERVIAVGGTFSAGPQETGFLVSARFPRRGAGAPA